MMSYTPETDSMVEESFHRINFPTSPVPAEFARRLERERNEAREAFVIATDQMVIAQGKVREANKERDEAREAFREMWQSGDAFLPHVDAETISRWRKAAGWEGAK
jgi:predicted house-cleaning NTP pyrophosphatase (Maf/HAM1 superfamily)